MESKWQAARTAMLIEPGVAYLNTGSYGPTPRPVFERVTELRRQLAAEPVDFLWRTSPPLLRQARERLGLFLRANPRQLIFTANVSAAINTVAASLRLAVPGEILIGAMEYGSMRYCWERAAQRQGLTLRKLPLPETPLDPVELVEAVKREIRPRTRMLFLSHVFYTTGLVAPVSEICAAARRCGILTVIDGAHAPGMVTIDLAGIGCDFYGANLHKWLLAPIGAGFLYAATGNQDRIQPLAVSWGRYYEPATAHEWDDWGSTPWIRSFELEGTRDCCPWLTVPAAIDFHEHWGPESIRARHRELSDYIREKIGGIGGLRLVTPEHQAMRGALTAFRLPDVDIESLRRGLWEGHRVEVPIVEHAEGDFLRISTHFYNEPAEIDRLALALAEMLPPR